MLHAGKAGLMDVDDVGHQFVRKKDILSQLLMEHSVQLHRRKCLEVYTCSQPNYLCPGGMLWEPGEDDGTVAMIAVFMESVKTVSL